MRFYQTLIIGLLFLTLLGSCDVLNQQPESVITQDSFWENGDDAEAGIVAAYDQLQTVMSDGYFFWGEMRADGIDFIEGMSNPGPNDKPLIDNELTTNSPGSDWTDLYRLIARTNEVLEFVPDITEELSNSEKEKILGEAHFLRALAYFYGIRLWGDVPLILEPYTSAGQDFEIPRSPVSEILSSIESDVNAAVESLTFSSDPARASKGAALALKAHVLAWQGDYAGAEAAANEVITSGVYQLLPGDRYADLFEQENTSESIFEIQYSNSNQEFNGLAEDLLARPYTTTILPAYGMSRKFLNMIDTDDPRFFFEISEVSGQPFITKYFGSPSGAGGGGELQLRLSDDNFIIYRLAGLILLRAEALNEIGRTGEALSLLDQVRNRVGLPNSTANGQAEVKQAILDERFIELSYEGHRWFDLIRNGVAVEILNDVNSEAQLLWPIHEDNLTDNPELEQNEFYQ